jgi:hypothetical protein
MKSCRPLVVLRLVSFSELANNHFRCQFFVVVSLAYCYTELTGKLAVAEIISFA